MVATSHEHRACLAPTQGVPMSRNFILAMGALLWGLAALDAFAHLAEGDLLTPAVMATAAILGVAVIGVRWARKGTPASI